MTKESTMDRLHQMRMSEMLDDLCTEKNEEWLKRKKRYIKCDLLIIDDWLLENANVVGTPGEGFGACGQGYFRLTAFGDADRTKEAAQRIKAALAKL